MNLNNSKNPLVSICIRTYNGGKFIKETLDTAVSQTYTNIEIIITDDKKLKYSYLVYKLFKFKKTKKAFNI